MTHKTQPLTSWMQSLRRRRPRVVDAADMGTCFGLDMSLEEPAAPLTPPEVPTFSRAWWSVRASRKAANA